jgi:tetratricopeptide (TPR) repeat protein
MMVRSQPKDEKLKFAWVEVLQYSQADQKLVHILVAFCGPPGLVSPEFQVGGEPTALSPQLFDALKKLVAFFPRDPKIAYAVAWASYRRGRIRDFYHYLRECLRRDPDFCLAILLLARVLADDKKLNEALYVYRFFKERMTADKSSDMLTLNRLMEGFIEKNGWIKFIEDSGDVLDTPGFLKAITGAEQKGAAPESGAPAEKAAASPAGKDDGFASMAAAATKSGASAPAVGGEIGLPPAEIELGGGDGGALEVVNATGVSIAEASKQKKPADPKEVVPAELSQAELIKSAVEAAVKGMTKTVERAPIEVTSPNNAAPVASLEITGTAISRPDSPAPVANKEGDVVGELPTVQTQQTKTPAPAAANTTATKVEGFQGQSVVFTALIKPGDLGALSEPEKTIETAALEDQTMVRPVKPGELSISAAVKEEETKEIPATPATPEPTLPQKGGFNPMEAAQITPAAADDNSQDRTQMFSPMEVLAAAKVMQNREVAKVDTKEIIAPNAPAPNTPPPVPASKDEADKTKWKSLQPQGTNTEMFAPVEAVAAAAESRRPIEMPSPVAPPSAATASPAPVAPAAVDQSDATQIVSMPPPAAPVSEPEADGTQVVAMPAAPPEPPPPPAAAEPTPEPPSLPPTPSSPESPAFMPIPTMATAGKKPENDAPAEVVDLGDDLLEGPTKIFTQPTSADKTEHLIKEIKQELKQKSSARLNIEVLMKKAERYTAKRNYYLARKALRHAQALGADEVVVKERLREIRKLELPEGLYNSISSDSVEKVDTNDVLERLEQEFDLAEGEDSPGSEELRSMVERRIDTILQENDPRTILDFGVGLHEMGLFRQAEALFMRLVEEYPDHSFDAYYLAAISKLSRRDYAGAAAILKRLSSDTSKTDLEKIQIYYVLGETFQKMRQPARSKQFFKKVAELDANYRNVRHKLEE